MLTIEMLRCFRAVVETGSFREAAERLLRSQPAVSQQIKALERRVGHTLIERRTGRPTPAGQLLHERARNLLNVAESLSREMADFDESAVRELRLGTSDTTALYFLPGLVRRFAAQSSGTPLVIVNRPSKDIAEQVSRGDIDLGIVTLPVVHGDLESRDLFEEELVLVTPPNHRLAGRKRIGLRGLGAEPLLLLHADTRTGAILRDFFRERDFVPRVVLDTGSFEVIKRYVAAGIGCSFLPRMALQPGKDALPCLSVPGLPHIRIGAIWRRGAHQGKAQRQFLDILMAREA